MCISTRPSLNWVFSALGNNSIVDITVIIISLFLGVLLDDRKLFGV